MTATYQELIEQREALDRQIQEVKEQEKRIGLEKVLALIEEYGLTSDDLFSKRAGIMKSGSKSVAKVPPKYRNPETGKTWTGRGKKPLWMAERSKEYFLIK